MARGIGAAVSLREEIDAAAAATRFSGVARVDRGETVELAAAYGFAHRPHAVPNRLDTLLGIASGTKGLTALAAVSLIDDGTLSLETPARSLLGSDLPAIDGRVTVEHLLAHRSGIGDYFDEDVHSDVTDYVLPVPVHQLATTEDYLAVLEGHESKFAPDERFSYSNSGFVVLALLAERATGVPFHELVHRRVCEPAGMIDTAFLRTDELPARAATGYLTSGDDLRTNVLHLPVRGSGDGGIYSTVEDIARFWGAFFAGRIVSREWTSEMTRVRTQDAGGGRSYGLGFWLDPSRGAVMLEGSDAGVSFWSAHDPARGLTSTVVSNTSEGAWPIARLLRDRLGGSATRPKRA